MVVHHTEGGSLSPRQAMGGVIHAVQLALGGSAQHSCLQDVPYSLPLSRPSTLDSQMCLQWNDIPAFHRYREAQSQAFLWSLDVLHAALSGRLMISAPGVELAGILSLAAGADGRLEGYVH